MKRRIIFIFAFLVLTVKAYGAVPYSFTNGVVSDATQVNSNFNYFENKFSTSSGHDHDGSNSKKIADISGITSGILGLANGGTGISTYTKGDLIYATSDTVLGRIPIGPTNALLKVTGGLPVWSAGAAMFYADTRFTTGQFTRDLGTGAGTQVVSGLASTPKAFIFIGGLAAHCMSFGFDDLTSPVDAQIYTAATTGFSFNTGHSQQYLEVPTTSDKITMKVTSVTSSDFTVTWGNVEGNPAGTANINYIAFY